MDLGLSERIRKYWRMIIRCGLNVTPGQKVLISAPARCADMVEMAASAAYDAGASRVVPRWDSAALSRMGYLRGDPGVWAKADPWDKAMLVPLAREGAAFLFIHSTDPRAFEGVDPGIIVRSRAAFNKSVREWSDRYMANRNRWCVAAAASPDWARAVFPDLSAGDANDALWEAILSAAYIGDGDAEESWVEHADLLSRRTERLNAMNLRGLLIRNGLGTKLYVGLPAGHIWLGGREPDAGGIVFSPNIPTEEVFTAPDWRSVNGVVKSSLPLVYQGNVVRGFSFTFRSGRIVKIEAEEGRDLLVKATGVDKGASYLGEVALVPYHSPISRTGLLFFDTLFDENASCHLAFGKAYPKCVAGADGRPGGVQRRMGVNRSSTHVDFMFGTPDLEIIGVADDGRKVRVFREGNFAEGF
ncbi:MAG: aminopeptidase [Clostridiales bacterium]|jgi:aminopeptidase|nr:aminopeptidase [Clostridiales bacterium]